MTTEVYDNVKLRASTGLIEILFGVFLTLISIQFMLDTYEYLNNERFMHLWVPSSTMLIILCMPFVLLINEISEKYLGIKRIKSEENEKPSTKQLITVISAIIIGAIVLTALMIPWVSIQDYQCYSNTEIIIEIIKFGLFTIVISILLYIGGVFFALKRFKFLSFLNLIFGISILLFYVPLHYRTSGLLLLLGISLTISGSIGLLQFIRKMKR